MQHRGFPVITVEHTILHLASVLPVAKLRRTLADAEYRQLLDADSIAALLSQRRPGAASYAPP